MGGRISGETYMDHTCSMIYLQQLTSPPSYGNNIWVIMPEFHNGHKKKQYQLGKAGLIY